MANAPVLTSERLRLRPHVPDDFDKLAALYASERSRFIGGPLPAKAVWRWFACDVGQWALLGHGAWAIELKTTGSYVGQVAILQPATYPEPELGWLLFDGFEGQGYALEAARRALDFAFDVLGAASLVSYIDPANTASIRLARRLDAVHDRQARQPEGEDCMVFRHDRPATR